jgi:hypothetical protein
MALQHLRSSTADKRPTPAAMSDGQLALNTNLVSPGLFFKDSNGDSVKIGPVHVGTTAPNATPGAGGQAGNSKGEAWLDTTATNPILKVWNGSAFVAVQPVGTGTVVSTTDTGTVTSTMILDGTILNADINASAAIVDTKLATIATAGKVSNSATTATNANTASAIVARDGSGNFTAGTITAALTGAASSNVLKAGDTMTGALVHPLGAVGTPSITFTGDLNTGIWSPAADTVAASTAGSERLRITSAGLVGIGTGAPAAILHTSQTNSGSSVIGAAIRNNATAASTGVILDLSPSDNSPGVRSAQIEATNNGSNAINLAFKTSNGDVPATRMTLDYLGRLGIGTTSPAKSLQVQGEVQIGTSGVSGTYDVYLYPNTSGQSVRWVRSDNGTLGLGRGTTAGVNEDVRIDSGGRLLVGTSTNYAIGDSSGWSVQVGNSAGISNLRTGNNSSPSYLVLAKTRATSAGSFAILQNNDIVGDISFAADDGTDYATNAAKIRCEVDGTPGANDMPGRLVFSTTADGNAGPTERMRIRSDGNIGIGATTPTEKLTVSGNVSVSGNVQAASINNGPLAGMRNAIINGNFDHWQRGTSFTGAEYGADRWNSARSVTTHTATRQAFTLGQTDVPGEPAYYCRTVVSSVAGVSNFSVLGQFIESVKSFAGQQITLSFWAKADATKNIAIEFTQNFGTGGSPSAEVPAIGVVKKTLTTSWQKITHTVTITSISGKTLGSNNNDMLRLYIWFDAGSDYNSRTDSLGQQSGTFDIAQVQVEPGPVATPFERRPIGTELALCQRYYEYYDGPASFLTKLRESDRNRRLTVPFKVTKRSTPTVVLITSTADGGGAIGVASPQPDGVCFDSFATNDAHAPSVSKFSAAAEL